MDAPFHCLLKLTAKHANLPSTLSIFSNFLLGEIFSQVGRLHYNFYNTQVSVCISLSSQALMHMCLFIFVKFI